ncbi:hypothetical protein [Curtobacterium herbarum]|uniref:Uncharacterized protein n=1 Tax=Curtobacterium herbarum TaxID=150122 RepID=A0ABN1Z8T4_9MICO|nr:hypothetical protein [Curtobacterium herbarum]MBM7476378.1 hypothetical protein [Curtobacterium herbarum]MCS6544057.1 hypothetical protein [Curtobacterium herbarum]
MSSRLPRLVPALVPALVLAAVLPLAAAVAPAAAAPSTPAHHSWLVTADPHAERMYVNDAATGRRTATLSGIEFGTHAGTVQLGHGRIAFMDESKPQLDVLAIGTGGTARIVQHYAIPDADHRWERAGWLATDTARRHLAVGSDFDGSTHQRVTVIDLQRQVARTAQITTSAVTLATTGKRGTEEVETFLVGSPLRLVVTAGGRLDAYSVSAIMRGEARPHRIATTPLGAYPHGPIVDATGTVIGSDLAAGVQTVRVTKNGFTASRSVAYPQPSVQSYRPRMAPDGSTAVGSQAGATTAGTSWDQVPAYLTTSSTASRSIRSVPLGTGLFTRAAVTSRFAAVALSSGSGDALVLVRKQADGIYDGRRTSIALQPLRHGPVAGQSATGAAVRFTAATDDGTSVFVTRGGEGTITQIDTAGATPSVTRTITVPSDLSDGGYLTTVDSTVRPYDLSGR